MRIWMPSLVLALAAAWPTASLAAKPVTVDLIVAEPEDLPTQVCVVSGDGEFELDATPDSNSNEANALAVLARTTCSVECMTGLEKNADAVEKDAVEKRYMRCSERRTDVNPKVLVLELTGVSQAELVAVTDVRVIGESIELDITHALDRADLKLGVIAGHYAKAETRLNVGYNSIDVSPRCLWVTVERPPMLFPERRRREFDAEYCERGDVHGGTFELLLPFGSPSNPAFFVRYIVDSDTLPKDEVVLKGDLPDARNVAVQLVLQTIAFSWRKDECFYIPHRECPDARIEQTGSACTTLSGPDDAICDYRCGPTGSPLAGLDFENLRIVFTDVNNPDDSPDGNSSVQSWAVNLNAIDQELLGHVADGQRVVRLDIEGGLAPRQPVDRLFGIDLRYVSLRGETVTRRVEVLPPRRSEDGRVNAFDRYVTMPDVGCRSLIDYRYAGERDYHEASAHIESGTLALEGPRAMGRRVYAVGSLAGGVLWPHMPGTYPSSDNPKLYPLIELEMGVGLWPRRLFGTRFELRGGAMQSVTPVEPIDGGANEVRPIAYSRFLLTAASYSPWMGAACSKCLAVAVGGGLSAVWGRPTMQADAQIFDPRFGSFDFGVRPFFDLRFRVTRLGRVEVFVRHSALLLEDDVAWVTTWVDIPHIELRPALRTTLTAGLAISL